MRELRPEGEAARRLVLFSDSRQDAAKLSAGLEKRHYQDLLREVLVEEVVGGAEADVVSAISFAEGERSDRSRAAWQDTKARFPALYAALNELRDDEPGARARVDDIAASLIRGRTVAELAIALDSRLVALGVSPAGPDPSAGREPPYRDGGSVGTSYRWEKGSTPRPDKTSPRQTTLSPKADKPRVLKECLLNVFSGNGRDLEGLALPNPLSSRRPPRCPLG